MHAAIRSPLVTARAPEERVALERFIAARFERAYGARVSHFCAQLVGVPGMDGVWLAAAGYTAAAASALFLEHYLQRPVEQVLRATTGVSIPRERIAEVGNLAADPGTGRTLIPALGRHLHALGFRWAVFTATRELRNAFRRLQLEPLALAPALASRLPDAGAAWGTYYAHYPTVMAGRIASCLESL